MKYSSPIFCMMTLMLSNVAYAGFFSHENRWECLLSELEGVKNDQVAVEKIRSCNEEFPDVSGIGKKQSIFGVKTAGECVIKYAEDVTSRKAARAIRYSCYQLYPD